METFRYRRLPAINRKISDINSETDVRVRIIGKVIDKSESTIIVDDGTGKAEIVVEEMPEDTLNFVRVFTRILPLETGYELRAELVQKFDSVDIDIYKKAVGW